MRKLVVLVVLAILGCSSDERFSTKNQTTVASQWPEDDAGAPDAAVAVPECACHCIVDGGAQDGAEIINEDTMTVPGKPDCVGAQNDANMYGSPPCRGFTKADFDAQQGTPIRDYSCPNGKFCRKGKWECGKESCGCPLVNPARGVTCELREMNVCESHSCSTVANSDAECAPTYTGAYCGCQMTNDGVVSFSSPLGITEAGCTECDPGSTCVKFFKRKPMDTAVAGYNSASCEAKFTPAQQTQQAQ